MVSLCFFLCSHPFSNEHPKNTSGPAEKHRRNRGPHLAIEERKRYARAIFSLVSPRSLEITGGRPWIMGSSPWSVLGCIEVSSFFVYHLVMTNIAMEAMEKPYKWRFRSLGKSSISMGHGFHGYVSHNLRVTPIILGKSYDNLPRIRWEL